MKIILDHCVDRRLAGQLAGYVVQTAAEMGWDALSNGKLLLAAQAAGFDVLVTTDKDLRHQQNLATLPISIVVLYSVDTRLQALTPMLEHFARALEALREGRFVIVHADGAIERVTA